MSISLLGVLPLQKSVPVPLSAEQLCVLLSIIFICHNIYITTNEITRVFN